MANLRHILRCLPSQGLHGRVSVGTPLQSINRPIFRSLSWHASKILVSDYNDKKRFTSGLIQLQRFQSSGGEKDATNQVLSQRERLKLAVRDYGSTVILFHTSISLASLGMFYMAVSSGLDVISFVSSIPYIGEQIASSQFGGEASTFVVAYAVHKVFAPVRISITLTSVPFIVRYLRARGVLKAKKPAA